MLQHLGIYRYIPGQSHKASRVWPKVETCPAYLEVEFIDMQILRLPSGGQCSPQLRQYPMWLRSLPFAMDCQISGTAWPTWDPWQYFVSPICPRPHYFLSFNRQPVRLHRITLALSEHFKVAQANAENDSRWQIVVHNECGRSQRCSDASGCVTNMTCPPSRKRHSGDEIRKSTGHRRTFTVGHGF
jgi:hypothetical protein